MPNPANVQRQVIRRITESPHQLTVHYPPLGPVVVGTGPTMGPLSPLTGPPPDPEVIPDEAPALSHAPVTLQCLWLDAYGNLVLAIQSEKIGLAGKLGWMAGANALARVLVREAALDPDDPWGDTVFTGAERVGFRGHDYHVMAVEPLSGSMGVPVTYYVWLRGATKQ